MRYHLVVNGKSSEYDSESELAQRMKSIRSNSIAQINIDVDDTLVKITMLSDPQDCLMN